MMDRRNAIKRAGYFLGMAVSSPAIAGVLNGCMADSTPDWQPAFLIKKEVKLVSAVSARIIPSNGTPGAIEAGVPQYIDVMLSEYYLSEIQEQFRTGLTALEAQSQTVLQQSFVDSSKADQDRVLTEQSALAKQQLQTFPEGPTPFFLMIKELTLLGFFTSEIGATKVLQYEEVPGGFQGCVLLDSLGGKAWAT